MKFKKATSFILSLIMAVSSLNMCFAEEAQAPNEAQTEAVTEEEAKGACNEEILECEPMEKEVTTEDNYINGNLDNVISETETESVTKEVHNYENDSVSDKENNNAEDIVATKDEEIIVAEEENHIDNVVKLMKQAPWYDGYTISYAVSGGYIYFDPTINSIVDADASIRTANIPSTIAGYSVTAINDYAFDSCYSLTSVSIPSSVTSIGDCVFAFDYSLRDITIPNSVTYIGEAVFTDCSFLSNITIPNSVTHIGQYTFDGCSSLTKITLSDKLTSIEYSLFLNCTNLSNIKIPDKVEYIGGSAFKGCTALTTIDLPKNLTSIHTNAFENCKSLTSINLPDSLTTISNEAFTGCSALRSIKIPKNNTAIGYNTFYECTSLSSVEILSAEFIGQEAFYNCSNLTSVKLPNNLTEIGNRAFFKCNKLDNIQLPDSLLEIKDGAFGDCPLKGITIPKNVNSIGIGCFYYFVDNLYPLFKDIQVSNENMYFTVVDGVLYNKDKTELVLYPHALGATHYRIPDNVTNIRSGAFAYNNVITDVTISGNVKALGDNIFSLCHNLKNVYIESGVEDIGQSFDICFNKADIVSIILPESIVYIDSKAFEYYDKDKLVFYVKQGSYADTWAKQNGFKVSYSGTPSDNPTPSVNVAPPSFAVKGVFGGRDVTFNCKTSGATIYYTTANRSTLNLNDPHVKPGETVHFDAYYGTIYARAYYNGKWGNVARLILKIPKVNDPTITKLSNGKVKIKTTTPSCIVYYTTDGSTPSASNYAGKFWTSHDVKIPAGKTVKAIAVRSCFSDSKVTTGKA